MAAYVQAFNNLPRCQTTPTGLLERWYFIVRHVPLQPPGDLLNIVHPESCFAHCEGPRNILSLPTLEEQSDVVVELLLKSFVEGISRGPNGEPIPETPPYTPWSWCTNDPRLGRLVEKKLTSLRVRSELCTVLPATKSEKDAADKSWAGVIERLIGMSGQTLDTPREGRAACNGCNKDVSWFSFPLQRCSQCNSARYCSKNCQKKDWKGHKQVCGKSASNATGQASRSASHSFNSNVGPLSYYADVVPTVPEAKLLAKSIGLAVPDSNGGLRKPVRRLVYTGKDTPENLQLLFGLGWNSPTLGLEKARIEILLDPPPGSPCHSVISHMKLDVGAPERSPRPPTATEAEKIQTVRELQSRLRSRMGSRKAVNSQDMQAILSSSGGDWVNMLPLYELATNTMDQGSPSN